MSSKTLVLKKNLRYHTGNHIKKLNLSDPHDRQLKYSEEAMRILNLSVEEARRLNNILVDPFHILLAIMKQATGIAKEILEAEAKRNGLNDADIIENLTQFWQQDLKDNPTKSFRTI